MLASMALTNPDKLAMMAAAKGIQPPEGGALPMAPGPSSGMSPTQMINPSAAPMAEGGQTSVAVPQPEVAAPPVDPMAAISGLGALAPPSAGGGGGSGGNPPAPFIPGALASQMPQIMAMLMAGGGGQIPGIGAQILGR